MILKTPALGLLAVLCLSACGSTPPALHYTLDEGAASTPPQGTSPAIVIVHSSLPDEVDRPQLIVRQRGQPMTLDEARRWAEPLRRGIPRALAADLGRILDSSRVIALPADAQRFDADFRLFLDVQRFDAVAGHGADVDIVWRFEPREGKPLIGRSTVHEAATGTSPDRLVAALRRALRLVAGEMAMSLRRP